MTLSETLQEIKDRADAATEGKWEVCVSNDRTAADIFIEEKALICEMSNGTMPDENMQFNAQFIAHARQDIPMLLEMVELLSDTFDFTGQYFEDSDSTLVDALEKIRGKYK